MVHRALVTTTTTNVAGLASVSRSAATMPLNPALRLAAS